MPGADLVPVSENVEGRTVQGEVEALVLVDPKQEQFSGYAGAGLLRLTEDEEKRLGEVFDDSVRDILPTGEVYVAHIHVRQRLNTVIGRGQWALVPRSKETVADNTVAQKWALCVRGHFISESWGEMEYHSDSDRSSYPSAVEGAKSNALTRCAKDLGIAWECWDKRQAERFKSENCVQVWRQNSKKPQWRRKDTPAWYDEKGFVAGNKPEPPQDTGARAPEIRQDKPAPEGPPIQEGHRGLLLKVARSRGLLKGNNTDDLKKFIAKHLGRSIGSSTEVLESEFDGLLSAIRELTVVAEEKK